MKIRSALILAILGIASAQPQKAPVALVVSATGATVRRANTELPLTLKPGEVLFQGDSIAAASGSVRFLFCPERSSHLLAGPGEVLFEANKLRVQNGRLAESRKISSCVLPPVDGTTPAGQQHYGASLRSGSRELAGSFESRLQAIEPAKRQALLAELEPVNRQLASEPGDVSARVSRAALLDRFGLVADARAEYEALAKDWPDAVWIRSRLFVLEEEREAKPEPRKEGKGKTYALLIGVSRYQSGQVRPLEFADRDALTFADFVRSARGGSLPESDVVLLTNERATTAAIRTAFETFLKSRAGPDDTIVLFIASHGVSEPGLGAHIVTYDSDPQDLATTALPMSDVQKLLQRDLSRVGRVMAYVDACRSGTIGTIVNKTVGVNSSVEQLGAAEGELFLFTASRAKEISYEGPQFGGGHGAFTYFLLNAFNGDADRNQDGAVDMNEVIDYVRSKVAEGTYDKQHPRDLGTLETSHRVADLKAEGIRMLKWNGPPPEKQLMAQAVKPSVGEARGTAPAASPAVAAFEAAIAAGRLSPDDPGGAFALLSALKRDLDPEDYLIEENKLRVALEEKGQQVILKYLAGDQVPQTKADFLAGASLFEAARRLTPESLLLDARAAFCRGRAKIFDKDYAGAMDLLERAARADPAGAYSYNALGIAYLEQANYRTAMSAFRDAIRLAPHWPYPLHNLALAHTEMGDSSGAIRLYEQAMKLAPRAAYLPYNLGLVYQRLNRRKEAEASYRNASLLAPDLAEPYNAMGALEASTGHFEKAEQLYRQALAKNPSLLAARHNLALLLSENAARTDEALALFRANLSTSPDYVPSRLSLARVLATRGRTDDAIAEYSRLTQDKPDYVGARLALSELYERTGKPASASRELKEALTRQPRNPALWERLGDIERQAGEADEARKAYASSLQFSSDSAARKRVRAKVSSLAKTR